MSNLLDVFSITDTLACANNGFVLYLSVSSDHGLLALGQAVPFLNEADRERLWFGERLWLTYASEVEALAAFNQVIGDDGPTKTNSYDGPARVYAYLAGPAGGITENT